MVHVAGERRPQHGGGGFTIPRVKVRMACCCCWRHTMHNTAQRVSHSSLQAGHNRTAVGCQLQPTTA